MSDEKPPSTIPQQKHWYDRISQFLTGELQDRNELFDVLKEARGNRLMDADAHSMIEGVLKVSEMRAREIMVPRIQMVVVEKDAELEDIFSTVIESAHSRFPVITEDRSEVVGILLAKDLLIHTKDKKPLKVADIMRSARFIPESKRLNILLKEFRTIRNHMAIVIDEYGTAAGLVTIEDVLEQIVGEIEDEHDIEAEDLILKRNDNEYTVKAITPIDDFNDYFSVQIEDGEFETIGGFIVHELEYMPKKGEKLEFEKFRFEVLRADNRRIHLLKLKLIQ